MDLTAAQDALQHSTVSAAELMEHSLEVANSTRCKSAFLLIDQVTARAAAVAADKRQARGAGLSAVDGLAVSIKDLFDIAGQVTCAGSTVLARRPAARADASAVRRLRGAGAALIGRTNMTEFAYSAMGANPHYGTPHNGATLLCSAEPRIPGGSTSGGAVSVATGAAWAALGSDTGGSIRIPAALQGLVGFKNTARMTPREGAIPLAPTLDTVCALTLSVRDAVVMHELLSDRRADIIDRPLSDFRLAVPQTAMLDDLDTEVERAFQQSLLTLRKAGAWIDEITLPELAELPDINAKGGFAAAESWAWHRRLLADHEAEYDPRIVTRIRRGEAISAADYIDLQRHREDWQRRVNRAILRFDAILSPTVPMVAPPLKEVASDEAFFDANTRLLRNPAVVNMLDGCALSLPCHRPGDLPVGLMVWHGALRDDVVLSLSLGIEAALARGRYRDLK